MKIREIESDIIDSVKKAGEKVYGNNNVNQQSYNPPLQYPAQRASANDSGGGYKLTNLYQNGLLFTAHNLTNRKTGDIQTFRNNNRTTIVGNTGALKDTVATILMPRSVSEADAVSHKLGDVKDTVLGKGGGTVMGALSNMISDQIWKSVDSAAGGMLFSDHNEQMYTASRSTYQGAEKRTKVFTWNLVPQNSDDLKQLYSIYRSFYILSYGRTGRSGTIDGVSKELHDSYVKQATGDSASKLTMDDTILGKTASFLTNVNIVTNPTVWMIRNFYANDTEANMDLNDVFGPAQIQSIRLDKTPDGHFNGLSKYPNISGSYMLEVTMKEIISLSSADVGGIV